MTDVADHRTPLEKVRHQPNSVKRDLECRGCGRLVAFLHYKYCRSCHKAANPELYEDK